MKRVCAHVCKLGAGWCCLACTPTGVLVVCLVTVVCWMSWVLSIAAMIYLVLSPCFDLDFFLTRMRVSNADPRFSHTRIRVSSDGTAILTRTRAFPPRFLSTCVDHPRIFPSLPKTSTTPTVT